MGTSYVDGSNKDGRCSRKCEHELELWTELEVGEGGHVVAANVLRMAALDYGGDGWWCCDWWWPCWW